MVDSKKQFFSPSGGQKSEITVTGSKSKCIWGHTPPRYLQRIDCWPPSAPGRLVALLRSWLFLDHITQAFHIIFQPHSAYLSIALCVCVCVCMPVPLSPFAKDSFRIFMDNPGVFPWLKIFNIITSIGIFFSKLSNVYKLQELGHTSFGVGLGRIFRPASQSQEKLLTASWPLPAPEFY